MRARSSFLAYARGPHLLGSRTRDVSHRSACSLKGNTVSASFVLSCPSSNDSRARRNSTAILSQAKQPPAPEVWQSLRRQLAAQLDEVSVILEAAKTPSEADTQKALQICEDLCSTFVLDSIGLHKSHQGNPTLSLLALDEAVVQVSPCDVPSIDSFQLQTAKEISGAAERIMTDPKVFITPKLLAMYVSIQEHLGHPESFPRIFDLYASKPIPQPNSFPIQYTSPNPNGPSAAIPLSLAHTALGAAIRTNDLSLCINIITTTVCATAFRRAKFIRKALFPSVALTMAPVTAYLIASNLAQYQDNIDFQTAATLGTGGILAYLGFTATIGFVAITTANDQMDRITWVLGTPLRERWIREEERALTDRVAGAWGFRDPEKRGEEEGLDWQRLRTWAMERGMILDNPSLMQGME